MKTGTKIGLVLIALSIVLSIWVIVGGSSDADYQEGDFILSDDGTVAIQYVGSGGSVTVPDGVVTLSDGLFKNNPSITSIYMPDSVSVLGAEVCSGCSQLQSVDLSSNISSIPSNAFRECSGLVSVSLPSVGSIGSNAFYGCSTLGSVTIPASCTSISSSAFANCDNLSEISVSSGNSNYSSSDGCLYNASKTRLIFVPGGKSSVSIASTCTTIGSGAFADAYYVSDLTVPESVTTIEDDAFSGSGIRTITIPESVTSIGGQSGWSPSTIYGYADSAAETFAKNNSIPFVVLGPGPGPEPEPEPTPTPTPDPDPEPTPYVPTPGDVVNSDGTVTRADGTVVDPTTGRVIRGGTGATGSSHTKDATPGTADGDLDPRYFLCIAVFLGGAGCIVYARHRKTKYIKNKK